MMGKLKCSYCGKILANYIAHQEHLAECPELKTLAEARQKIERAGNRTGKQNTYLEEVEIIDRGMRPLVMGIDPSLTGMGIILLRGDGKIYKRLLAGTPAAQQTLFRLNVLAEATKAMFKTFSPDLVVIEGLVMDRFGSGNDRAGLHWIIRRELDVEDRLQVVFPTTLKKWVCGTGAAQKEMMLMKTLKRWNEEFDDNNLCDAYCLAQWGQAYLRGEVQLPAPKLKKKKKEAKG